MFQFQVRPRSASRQSVVQQPVLRSQNPRSDQNKRSSGSRWRVVALAAITCGTLALSGCGGLTFKNSSSSVVALSQISCGTQSLTGAQSKSCSVTLNMAALTKTVVTLTSSSASLKIPSTVTIGVGSSAASFTAVSTAVSKATNVTISGAVGGVTKTAQIVLYPEAVSLNTVSCTALTVTGPTNESCSVTLSGSAASPMVVNLQSSSSALVVPTAVTVAIGSSTSAFTATVSAVTAAQSATLTASVGGVSKSAVLQIQGSGTQTAIQHKVQLDWQAPASSTDTIVGYKVYRMNSGATTYAALASSLDTQTSYTDLTVQSGLTYEYVVTSVDGSGVESAYSNPTTVTIP
jgi:hypothetical protein